MTRVSVITPPYSLRWWTWYYTVTSVEAFPGGEHDMTLPISVINLPIHVNSLLAVLLYL